MDSALMIENFSHVSYPIEIDSKIISEELGHSFFSHNVIPASHV